MEDNKPHGNTGKRNAAKPTEEILDSQIFARCTKAEKAAYVRAAAGKKLSDWVRDELNKAASNTNSATT